MDRRPKRKAVLETAASAAGTPSTDEDEKIVPPFILKLMAMINDTANDHMITWNPTGSSIIVHDSNALGREVLPKYYKHSNFTSLVRQLNMYGFHKVIGVEQGGLKQQDQQYWEFSHPHVQRDHPELLHLVKRKDQEKTSKKKLQLQDVDSVLVDLNALRAQHEYVNSRFREMELQNQVLYNEVVQLRQQQADQQWKVAKIMEFLARYVKEQPSHAHLANEKRPKLALENPTVEDVTNDDVLHMNFEPVEQVVETPDLDSLHQDSGPFGDFATEIPFELSEENLQSHVQGLGNQFDAVSNKLISNHGLHRDVLENLLLVQDGPAHDGQQQQQQQEQQWQLNHQVDGLPESNLLDIAN